LRQYLCLAGGGGGGGGGGARGGGGGGGGGGGAGARGGGGGGGGGGAGGGGGRPGRRWCARGPEREAGGAGRLGVDLRLWGRAGGASCGGELGGDLWAERSCGEGAWGTGAWGGFGGALDRWGSAGRKWDRGTAGWCWGVGCANLLWVRGVGQLGSRSRGLRVPCAWVCSLRRAGLRRQASSRGASGVGGGLVDDRGASVLALRGSPDAETFAGRARPARLDPAAPGVEDALPLPPAVCTGSAAVRRPPSPIRGRNGDRPAPEERAALWAPRPPPRGGCLP
jgi:hypothetical protein